MDKAKPDVGAFGKCCSPSHLRCNLPISYGCLRQIQPEEYSSIYETIQILGISVFDKTSIQ